MSTLITEKAACEARQPKLPLVFEGLAESAHDNPKQLVTDLLLIGLEKRMRATLGQS